MRAAAFPSDVQSVWPFGPMPMWRAGPGTRVRQTTPGALGVDDDDLLADGVGDVRERRARVHRRVPRRREPVDLGANACARSVDERHDAVLGVRDERHPVVHRLDASRPRRRADTPEDLGRLRVEHDDVALEVRGHVRNRRTAETGGERERLGDERQRAGGGGGEEAAPVHDANTRGAGREVPDLS